MSKESRDRKRAQRAQDRRDLENVAARQRQEHRARIKARLDAEAAEEEAIRRGNKKLDAEFEREAKHLFGDYIDDIERDLEKGQRKLNDPDIQKAINAIVDAKKAARGGFFSGKNPAKAKRILRANKGKIRKAQRKKGWFGW